jgi:hypothetical protein
LHGTDDCVGVEDFLFDQGKYRHADLLHVLCQVNSKFFPTVANVAAETAWFVFGMLRGVATTSFHDSPYII